ncbi:sensor histidine kinase, partial [Rhizobium johnstonii]
LPPWSMALRTKLLTARGRAEGREADGRLVIIDSPRMRSLKAEAERLWFIVADQDGRTVSYGAIPEAYRGLADYIRLIKE